MLVFMDGNQSSLEKPHRRTETVQGSATRAAVSLSINSISSSPRLCHIVAEPATAAHLQAWHVHRVQRDTFVTKRSALQAET